MSVVGSVAFGADIPHIFVTEAWALDMDRTLVDVRPNIERLVQAAGHFGVDGEVIYAAQKQVEADGGSIDPLQFVEEALDEESFSTFGKVFITEGVSAKYDDTDRLLGQFDGTVPFVIPTYGVNPLWQGMKARLLGRPVYMEVMPDSNKGRQIEGWRGAGGTFDFIASDEGGEDIAVYHARSVILVDDKVISHAELPSDCYGVRLKRPGVQLKSQGDSIPEAVRDRVRTVATLDEITVAGNALASATIAAVPAASSFRPAYDCGGAYPGALVTPTTSFQELQVKFPGKSKIRV